MGVKILAAAATAALIGLAGVAEAKDFQAGGQPKLKVTKLQMGIKSPATNTCPAEAKLTAWVFTNKAGNVPIYIARDGGGSVSGPYVVKTKATGNGQFMGTYSRTLQIHQPINAKYRASAPGFKQLSNWVPLKASCKIGLGGNDQLGG
ncbi:MAG: hypothetical protein NXI27_17615 [Alphaproteobacteria bacterium]|nr:hypothetical protein [Alphaproteobacteria bacterium]